MDTILLIGEFDRVIKEKASVQLEKEMLSRNCQIIYETFWKFLINNFKSKIFIDYYTISIG